jgi:cholesterol oxidase
MAFLATFMVAPPESIPRWLAWLGTCLRHPVKFLRRLWPFGWATRTVICLVMQTLDNHMELRMRRRWWWPFGDLLSSRSDGKMPTCIPAGDDAARAVAKRIDGEPSNAITEVVFNTPITAHILGGCPIGADAEVGVIDTDHKVFGYEDMYVVDGSAIPANLGVNPSLTITAMAERAMSLVPTKK